MSDSDAARASIQITEHGPYIVSGGVPLSEQAIGLDDSGNAWTWIPGETYELRERYALCRCGRSQNKPFCDGSHAREPFDGTETASRAPFAEQARVLNGPTMDLQDAEPLCAFARFCDGYNGIWNNIEHTDAEGTRQVVAYQATHCPSGRLVVHDKLAQEAPLEAEAEPSIVLVEDPQQDASGPIWVRGAIRIVSADAHEHEPRNRVTLCRCGESKNKPFCDGTHAHVGFRAHEGD